MNITTKLLIWWQSTRLFMWSEYQLGTDPLFRILSKSDTFDEKSNQKLKINWILLIFVCFYVNVLNVWKWKRFIDFLRLLEPNEEKLFWKRENIPKESQNTYSMSRTETALLMYFLTTLSKLSQNKSRVHKCYLFHWSPPLSLSLRKQALTQDYEPRRASILSLALTTGHSHTNY